MKINAVITKRPSLSNEKRKIEEVDRNLLAIASIMMLSIVSGALIYRFKSDVFSDGIFKYFVAFSTDLSGKSFAEAFSGFFAVDLSVLLLISVFGVSAYGRVPILLTVIFRLLGIGALGSFLLDKYSAEGIKFFLAVIVPGKLFMLFALLLSAQNCFQTSKLTKQAIDGKNTEEISLKLFWLRNIVSAAIFLISALVDTLALRFLSPLFKLEI